MFIQTLDKEIQQIKSENAILKAVYDDATDLYARKNQVEEENKKLKQLFA